MGKIYFTESVFLAMNKNEVSIGFVGTKKVKGIPHPIKVYTVLGKYDKIIRKLRIKRKKATRLVARILSFFLAALLIGAIIAVIIFIVMNEGAIF